MNCSTAHSSQRAIRAELPATGVQHHGGSGTMRKRMGEWRGRQAESGGVRGEGEG